MGTALAALTSTVHLTGCFRNYSANTVSSQIKVTGFRKVLNNITYSLWVDESTRNAAVLANRSGVTIGIGDGFNTTSSIFHHRPATTGTTAINNTIGGGQAHENMPPYIVVNVWKRTA